MRLSVYVLGALVAMAVILGSLFKMMHWKGADVILVTGWVSAALFFVPAFAIYKYKKGRLA